MGRGGSGCLAAEGDVLSKSLSLFMESWARLLVDCSWACKRRCWIGRKLENSKLDLCPLCSSASSSEVAEDDKGRRDKDGMVSIVDDACKLWETWLPIPLPPTI